MLIDTAFVPRQTGAVVDTTVAQGNGIYEANGLRDVSHAVQVIPLDTFGEGVPTSVASEAPLSNKSFAAAQDNAFNFSQTAVTVLEVSIPVRANIGSVYITAKGTIQLAPGESASFILREDTTNGTTLDVSSATNLFPSGVSQTPVNLQALWIPTSTESKTFHLVAQTTGTYTVSSTFNKLIAQYVIGE